MRPRVGASGGKAALRSSSGGAERRAAADRSADAARRAASVLAARQSGESQLLKEGWLAVKAELLLQLRSVVVAGLCQWEPGGELSGAENLAGRLNSLQLGSQYIAVRL